MKATSGKVIVRFFAPPPREVLLPQGSEPYPIEAEIVDDHTETFNPGQRVIVSRMGGLDWGEGTLLATVEPEHVLFVRRQGKVVPAPNYLVVENTRLSGLISTPQNTVNDITNRGVVQNMGDGRWDFDIGAVVFYEPFSAVQVRINSKDLHLVRADDIYAFEEAA